MNEQFFMDLGVRLERMEDKIFDIDRRLQEGLKNGADISSQIAKAETYLEKLTNDVRRLMEVHLQETHGINVPETLTPEMLQWSRLTYRGNK